MPIEQILLEIGYDSDMAMQLAQVANTAANLTQTPNSTNMLRQQAAEDTQNTI